MRSSGDSSSAGLLSSSIFSAVGYRIFVHSTASLALYRREYGSVAPLKLTDVPI